MLRSPTELKDYLENYRKYFIRESIEKAEYPLLTPEGGKVTFNFEFFDDDLEVATEVFKKHGWSIKSAKRKDTFYRDHKVTFTFTLEPIT